ncbi:hypothetical protein BHM03_00018611 [Ensete ventricosum]|nr:hypothetical protein BHM03_00018611 [Ensete ventricosum]
MGGWMTVTKVEEQRGARNATLIPSVRTPQDPKLRLTSIGDRSSLELYRDSSLLSQELTESWSGFRRCARELTESSLKLTEVRKMLSGAVENSPKVCQEVRREFANKLSGARRKFTGRMLGVRREFTEGDRELVGGPPKGCRGARQGFTGRMSGVHREFAERSIDDRTTKIMHCNCLP